ncbi:putative DNA adenine methylase protein [Vibrio phage 141O35-1]|nr:putative DNA adenine methylase protein [Vibrio phage 141O35-1]CAH9016113.1 putative DNA adenine methylase protein [Vibrio phage 141E35-1]
MLYSQGGSPPTVLSEDEYNHYKQYKECYDKGLIGYVGFQLSYGAMWFGSYRRDKQGSRDYGAEAYRNVTKQLPLIRDVMFFNASYDELPFPDGSLIYCDPPYENTASYKNVGSFNHDNFWQWCRDKSDEGHTIFVSEYNAPADFACIWEKQVNSSLTKDTGG